MEQARQAGQHRAKQCGKRRIDEIEALEDHATGNADGRADRDVGWGPAQAHVGHGYTVPALISAHYGAVPVRLRILVIR